MFIWMPVHMLTKELRKLWSFNCGWPWGLLPPEVNVKVGLKTIWALKSYPNTYTCPLGKRYEMYHFMTFQQISVQSLADHKVDWTEPPMGAHNREYELYWNSPGKSLYKQMGTKANPREEKNLLHSCHILLHKMPSFQKEKQNIRVTGKQGTMANTLATKIEQTRKPVNRNSPLGSHYVGLTGQSL